MKTLILVNSPTAILSLYSSTLAGALPFPASSQILPAEDARAGEWRWADWVLFGLGATAGQDLTGMENLPGIFRPARVAGKGFAVFQVQTRLDPPIVAAQGYALARRMRARKMRLLAPPVVFFHPAQAGWQDEGELLRATQWLARLAKRFMAGSLSSAQ